MKVLFVSSGNNKSFDIAPFIKEQGESLKKLGVQVDYFPVLGKGISGYLKAGLRLRSFLKENDYDLVHAHFTLSGWSAILGSRGKPIVLSLMGSDAYGEYVGENQVLFKSRYSTILTYLAQPFVKAIISKSKNIERYVYLKKKSYIVPNGIDREKFKPFPVRHRVSSEKFDGLKRVLFLGSKAIVRKNYPLAQEAVAKLGRAEVKLINPYPVSHTEIPILLNSVDVLLVPSFMEGSPNVVKEAMSCNCPIVATDTGDIKWVIGKTPGCYISSFEVEDFTENLRMALAFAEKEGRTNGAQRIDELGLDANTVAERIVGIYQKVLKVEIKSPGFPRPISLAQP